MSNWLLPHWCGFLVSWEPSIDGVDVDFFGEKKTSGISPFPKCFPSSNTIPTNWYLQSGISPTTLPTHPKPKSLSHLLSTNSVLGQVAQSRKRISQGPSYIPWCVYLEPKWPLFWFNHPSSAIAKVLCLCLCLQFLVLRHGATHLLVPVAKWAAEQWLF